MSKTLYMWRVWSLTVIEGEWLPYIISLLKLNVITPRPFSCSGSPDSRARSSNLEMSASTWEFPHAECHKHTSSGLSKSQTFTRRIVRSCFSPNIRRHKTSSTGRWVFLPLYWEGQSYREEGTASRCMYLQCFVSFLLTSEPIKFSRLGYLQWPAG